MRLSRPLAVAGKGSGHARGGDLADRAEGHAGESSRGVCALWTGLTPQTSHFLDCPPPSFCSLFDWKRKGAPASRRPA